MTREEVVDWHLGWMHLSASRGDAIALTRMFYESDVRDVLGTIRVPTLVLSRAGGAMEEEARAFAALIPGARRKTMPGTQPTVMQEHPEALRRRDRGVRPRAARGGGAARQRPRDGAVHGHRGIDGQAVGAGRPALGGARPGAACRRSGLPRAYRGRELDTAGDGFFAAFDGPARGIRCAQAIVEGVRSLGLEVRAGLHTGECRTVDDKIGGLAVSIGARVSASPARPRFSSHRPCATSWRARAWGSPTAGSTS